MGKLDIDIENVADLANLKLSTDQKKKFSSQLKEILTYATKLDEVNTKNVDTIGQITNSENVTRIDKAAPSLSQQNALKNAPRTYNGFFEVDAVFQEND